MKFNPNNHEERSGGDLIPAGTHLVEVVDHEIGTTSGGFTQVIVTYRARDGRTRKDWLICEDAAAWQFASLCHAVGATEEIDLDNTRSVKAAIYNRDLEIVVAEETYQGRAALKVKYRNKVKTGDHGAGRPPPRNAPPPARGGYGSGRQLADSGRDDAPPPGEEDDIPF